MKNVSVSKARASFSALIEEVRQGETVVITHRGKPVARIDPCSLADVPDGDRVKSLAARGLAVPPRNLIDVERFLATPRPNLPEGVDASDYIVEERGESR